MIDGSDIVEYRRAHRPQVLSIWSQRLGEEYADDSVLERAADPESDVRCFVAEQESRAIGFAILRLIGPERVAEKLRRPSPPDWATHPVGLLDTGAVAEPAEGRGVGTRLLERSVRWLRQQDANPLLAVSWTRERVPDSRQLLSAAGFTHLATEEEYWYDESIEQGYDCPDCGHPCRCTAEIWILR